MTPNDFEICEFETEFTVNQFLLGHWFISVKDSHNYLHTDGVIRNGAIVKNIDGTIEYSGYFNSKELAEQAVSNYISNHAPNMES